MIMARPFLLKSIYGLEWEQKRKNKAKSNIQNINIFFDNIIRTFYKIPQEKVLVLAAAYSLWLPFFVLGGIFQCRSPPLRV